MTEQREPRWLLEEIVIAIHHMLIAEHGGLGGIRDRGLLASALARAKNKYEYEDAKPNVHTLAAAYAFGIARNHPFADGNKRVALVAAGVFLELNGWRLTADESDAVVAMRELAAGNLGEEELAAWFVERSQQRT